MELAHETILTISNLAVSFATENGPIPAVNGINLEIRSGETLALVGESGSGKSTVALAAMSLLPAAATVSGEITIDGHRIVGAGERDLNALRGSVVSMVFQEPATALNPLMRVGDQIIQTIRNHGYVHPCEARDRAAELLALVGISQPKDRMRAFPFQLSGGQRQRVVIAMAIANAPKLLIADEPTTALDVTVQAEILDLLRGLSASRSMGVLLITHNMGVVADSADRVAVMHMGNIVETGSVESVLLTPSDSYTKQLLAAVPRLKLENTGIESSEPEARPAGSVVHAENLTLSYGRGPHTVQALNHVTIDIGDHETVGLVGESGSGKSTAARVILGLLHPDSGSIHLFGRNFSTLHHREQRALRSHIGVVLQDPVASLDARMSVFECIAEPLRVHRRGMSRHDLRQLVSAVTDAVRLPQEVLERAPRELSGGQRQRVSLARAIIMRPTLLVADEPTSALDVSVQRVVLDLLTSLQEEFGFSCLFISHDLAVVQDISHRVYVMKAGEVVEQGLTSLTLSHPTTAYTSDLLSAVPLPDPVEQRARRLANGMEHG